MIGREEMQHDLVTRPRAQEDHAVVQAAQGVDLTSKRDVTDPIAPHGLLNRLQFQVALGP